MSDDRGSGQGEPSPYTEHAKLAAVHRESQACGSFLDWLLNEKKANLQVWSEEREVACWWCNSDIPNLIESLASIGDRDRECPVCKGAANVVSEGFVPLNFSVRGLLAEYFEIDQDKLETEKRAMLDALREANDSHAKVSEGGSDGEREKNPQA